MTRMLPPDEWPRLRETGCELPQLLQGAARDGAVIVVEQDGAIVGTCLVLTCVHAEGLWIHPDHRLRPSVHRRLLRATTRVVRERGVDSVCVSATSDAMTGWIEDGWSGVELPGRHFVMPLRGFHV